MKLSSPPSPESLAVLSPCSEVMWDDTTSKARIHGCFVRSLVINSDKYGHSHTVVPATAAGLHLQWKYSSSSPSWLALLYPHCLQRDQRRAP